VARTSKPRGMKARSAVTAAEMRPTSVHRMPTATPAEMHTAAPDCGAPAMATTAAHGRSATVASAAAMTTAAAAMPAAGFGERQGGNRNGNECGKRDPRKPGHRKTLQVPVLPGPKTRRAIGWFRLPGSHKRGCFSLRRGRYALQTAAIRSRIA
jgi:hypothetical protein